MTSLDRLRTRTSVAAALLTGLLLAMAAPRALVADSPRLKTGQEFGEGITMHDPLPLKKVLKNPSRHTGKPILLEATVDQVCQKKGCWMTLVADQPIRVRFKDYGFFVPKKAGGHLAYVQGELSEVEVPEATARHYAEDAGEDPSTIVGPQKGLEFLATGVRLVGMHAGDSGPQTRPQTRSTR